MTGGLKLAAKKEVARDTVLLHFDVLDCPDWAFAAGQFISLKFGEKSWRAYSIASTPEEKQVELLVRLIAGGTGSEALRAMVVGDAVPFRGPFGHFVLPADLPPDVVFCATGTGIAPMRGLIKTLPATVTPHVWYGGRDANDIAYLRDIKTWHPKVKKKLAFSRATDLGADSDNAHAGRITQFVTAEHMPKQALYFLCGNGDMVVAMRDALTAEGIGKEKIIAERFN